MEKAKESKKVTLSKQFLFDLDSLYSYGQKTFGEVQAQKYETEIWKLIENLSETYLIFPECRYLKTVSKMYRWIILDAHQIIYRITDEEIQLLRIIHSKRSISKIKASRKIKP